MTPSYRTMSKTQFEGESRLRADREISDLAAMDARQRATSTYPIGLAEIHRRSSKVAAGVESHAGNDGSANAPACADCSMSHCASFAGGSGRLR